MPAFAVAVADILTATVPSALVAAKPPPTITFPNELVISRAPAVAVAVTVPAVV